jgi:hypothetical protein
MNGPARQFVGIVENINVKGAGPNSGQLLFGLRADNGSKMALVVHMDTEPQVFAGMAALLAAAMQHGMRVQATYQPAQPTDKATEIELRREW